MQGQNLTHFCSLTFCLSVLHLEKTALTVGLQITKSQKCRLGDKLPHKVARIATKLSDSISNLTQKEGQIILNLQCVWVEQFERREIMHSITNLCVRYRCLGEKGEGILVIYANHPIVAGFKNLLNVNSGRKLLILFSLH